MSALLITLSEYDTRGSRWRETSLVAVSEWVGSVTSTTTGRIRAEIMVKLDCR
jgi:hypothetical protein